MDPVNYRGGGGNKVEWVKREDERRVEASRAHWAANVRERGLVRGQCCE